MGMPETKASVSNKISRGGFPASFFLATKCCKIGGEPAWLFRVTMSIENIIHSLW